MDILVKFFYTALACLAGGFRGWIIEKAVKAKKRAKLSGRRGEAREKLSAAKPYVFELSSTGEREILICWYFKNCRQLSIKQYRVNEWCRHGLGERMCG